MERGSPERSPPLRFSVSEDPAAPFDLEAYLERVEYEGPREPTLEALRGLHLAHVTTIPFENLDIQLGRPIRLDLESLQAKLVRARRGGYCFEQNHLFMAALRTLGFGVTPLAARVRFGTTEPTPRTHMLLRVDVDGAPWIADVGFGGDCLLEPIPLTDGEAAVQHGWAYRLIRETSGVWVLQSLQEGAWLDLYGFLDEPTPFVDYVLGNHFTSTHPGSHFVRTLTAQMCAPDVRVVLRNLTLWETTPGGGTVRTVVPDEDALLEVLSERFGLVFPAGTRFRALVGEGGGSPAVLGIHHVQLGMPSGREAEAEAFYGAALGLDRVPKPPELEARGGRWFRGPNVEVHLGVEEDFRPSRKAHPAFVVQGLADMRERLAATGIHTSDDVALAGRARCHVTDPFGNRIELIETGGAIDERA